MGNGKRVIACILTLTIAVSVSVSGVLSTSVVSAEELATQEVFYEAGDMKTYWEQGKAPVKENYVFGGWFSSDGGENYMALTPSNIDSNNDGEVDFDGTAYAKWVPSYVLSVKAQIDLASQQAGCAAGTDGKAFLRVISTVDSTDYREVGFDLFYDKIYKETENTAITKVYASIKNDATGSGSWTPQEVFGSASNYFSILKVSNISDANCDNILYVRPYWKTMDGTRVQGVSKYIRVMDGYDENRYISVPINLMMGSPVAAGRMQMTYDTNLTYIGYEPGVLLPNMEIRTDVDGIVKFLGSAATVNADVNPASDIYANVWFQVKDGAVIPEQWEFKMIEGDFCNWTEELVTDILAWDICY